MDSTQNIFLSGLSSSARASLLTQASSVELPAHSVLYEAYSTPRNAYFLLSGLASVVMAMPDGKTAEINFISREGVVAGSHLLGPASLSTRCVMHLAGSALRIPYSELEKAFARCGEVHARVLEFVQQQTATVAQIAGCNRLHNAEQRLARCLLMAQAQTELDILDFTHEYLAEVIGTQRTTATMIAQGLQERGFIRYSRGHIRILSPAGLEAAACGCYPVIKGFYSGLYERSAVALSA